MRAWFFGLQMRERWIVGVGASAAALAIILWGFVRAAVARRDRCVAHGRRHEATAARRRCARRGHAAVERRGNRQGADQTLVVIINNTAGTYGLG